MSESEDEIDDAPEEDSDFDPKSENDEEEYEEEESYVPPKKKAATRTRSTKADVQKKNTRASTKAALKGKKQSAKKAETADFDDDDIDDENDDIDSFILSGSRAKSQQSSYDNPKSKGLTFSFSQSMNSQVETSKRVRPLSSIAADAEDWDD